MGLLKRLGLRGKRRSTPGEDRSLMAATIGKGVVAEDGLVDHEATANPLERALDIAAAEAAGTFILSIVRSSLWLPEGGPEETWQLKIRRNATVADVKSAIARVYKVPVATQRLQLNGIPGEPCLNDGAFVDSKALVKNTIHLLPTEEALREAVAVAAREEQYEAEMLEAAQAAEALQRELEDAVYKLRFVAPEDAGVRIAGQDLTLDIPALAPMGQVQAMVECAIFGGDAEKPRGLSFAFGGEVLPPQIPVYFAGIGDGDTLAIIDRTACFSDESVDEESDADSLDDGIRNWAFH